MTVFLGNVVMYFAFLFLFTYVLLVDFRPPPQGPSGPEVTLYFWVFTLVLEEIRQVSGGTCAAPPPPRSHWPGRGGASPASCQWTARPSALCPLAGILHGRGHASGEEAHPLRGRPLEQVRHGGHLPVRRRRHLQVSGAQRPGMRAPRVGRWAGRLQDEASEGLRRPGLSLAPVLCVLGEAPSPLWALAAPPYGPHPRMLPSVFEAGRAVLAVDFMVFTLRLIHIFAIHKQLGPKIIIVERMVSPGSRLGAGVGVGSW